MSDKPKPLYVNNDDLVRETLTYWDATSNAWLPFVTTPVTLTYCTRTVDAYGLVTYTPITGLGPFSMTLISATGANAGVWYCVTSAGVLAVLASDTYVGSDICHVVRAGSASPTDLMAVQLRAVLPEYNPA